MFERIKNILIKEFIQIFRDPRMKVIIFAMPVLQVMVFGYAVTTDVVDIPAAVYDMDRSPQSRELVRAFSYSRYFDIKDYISTDRELEELIDRSKVNTVIRIDRGFSRDITAGRTAHFQLIVDGTDSNTASIILNYAGQIAEKHSSGIIARRLSANSQRAGGFPHVAVRTRAWFNENLESRSYYVPGVIALIVMLITLLLTSMAIVREKEIGTMEQLIVSPIKSIELILGKLTPFALIGILDALLVTLVGVLWFEVPIRGSIALLFVFTCLYLLTTLGVGLFISTLASTQQEAMMSSFFFYFPAVLLSGFLFPIANMPRIIQYITYLNPLRYFLVVLRGIFLKGSGIDILWPQMIVLFVMGIAILLFSSMRFKKNIE